MEFHGAKLDLSGLAQVLMGLAAVLTAWKGVADAKKARKKNKGE